MYHSTYDFPMIITIAVGVIGVLSTHACLMPERSPFIALCRCMRRRVRHAIRRHSR